MQQSLNPLVHPVLNHRALHPADRYLGCNFKQPHPYCILDSSGIFGVDFFFSRVKCTPGILEQQTSSYISNKNTALTNYSTRATYYITNNFSTMVWNVWSFYFRDVHVPHGLSTKCSFQIFNHFIPHLHLLLVKRKKGLHLEHMIRKTDINKLSINILLYIYIYIP